MRREGDTLHLDGAVTMDTVPGLAEEARKLCTDGVRQVDFAGVGQLDSAAIALALDLARSCGGSIRFLNLPPAALKLAQLYSVADQLILDG